ncbi:lipoprotein signal peptidase [Brumimicrobium salinarum]|uniref:Lipoprotein signal peptidase n=1 Tax=Brumimicrobium salinarum TaxID=2058658 RepID=A0A2I0R6J4_9FLAO|nr:signal peptidase II [Brumimicrobium salinarum]PKR82218.1 lipoprotein signal peptidase [Brumimicrobium salinarum]
MKKRYLITFGVVLFILILDQAVKIWIKTSFSYDDPSIALIGEWFRLNYVENQGMAFGTQLGGGMWGKLLLSIFRIVAIIAIVYYILKQIKKPEVKLEFLIVSGLVLAGAAGNLFDSMFYDLMFPTYFDPCISYNQVEGSGIWEDCTYYGYTEAVEVRHRGFLFGNVVDMFQFYAHWPEWMPYLGGKQVFPAIWNIADAAISVGVILVLFRQKVYFPKQ